MRIYDYITDASLATLIKALYDRPKVLSAPVLAAKATADPDIKTTNNLHYTINNILYVKAAGNIDVSAAHTAVEQAVDTYCAYLVQINAAGDITILKGTDAASAALALAALPTPTALNCPFGIVVIFTDTAAFTFGTTNTDAAGVTDTYYDITDLPGGYGDGGVTLD